MKITNKIFLLSFLALFTASCNVPDIPIPSPTTTTIVGNPEVDRKFVESFDPPLAVGQKYAYVISNSKTNDTQEASTEVLEIKGTSIKVRIINSKLGVMERVGTLEDFSTPIPENKIMNEGTVTITVPAGEYKDTVKVSYFTEYVNKVRSKMTLWLVKNIGAVKIEETQPDFTVITSELREFKEKN